MSYSIEQEIKSLLSASHFACLLDHFQLGPDDYRLQENTYYDSPDQILKHARAALRLRNQSYKSEWTFKQAQDDYKSLELTYSSDHYLVPNPQKVDLSTIEDAVINDQLLQLGGQDFILYPFLSIKTYRWLVKLPIGEIALDKTYFGDQFDFEIELETNNLEEGFHYLQDLFQSFDIPFQKADKKIARALVARK